MGKEGLGLGCGFDRGRERKGGVEDDREDETLGVGGGFGNNHTAETCGRNRRDLQSGVYLPGTRET